MNQIGLTGLCKIELPDATIRLSDGGFIVWGAETFQSKDATFGTIASVDTLEEGVDAQVPALDIVMFPASTASAADLSQPGFQRSQVTFWLAEYDRETGQLDGDPDLLFDGQIDQTTLTGSRESRELAMSIVSTAERLFERNIGNSLSASFHKSIWPGETGHDNATGLGKPVAWGVEAPPSTSAGYYGSDFYGSGGGGRFNRGVDLV
jgi:hypothetical protein